MAKDPERYVVLPRIEVDLELRTITVMPAPEPTFVTSTPDETLYLQNKTQTQTPRSLAAILRELEDPDVTYARYEQAVHGDGPFASYTPARTEARQDRDIARRLLSNLHYDADLDLLLSRDTLLHHESRSRASHTVHDAQVLLLATFQHQEPVYIHKQLRYHVRN